MLAPRGYSPLYAFEIASHRLLRYASPFLHLARLPRQPRPARRRLVLLPRPSSLQLGLLAGGAAGAVRCPARRCGSPATTCCDRLDRAGLWDRWRRRRRPRRWEKAEGNPLMTEPRPRHPDRRARAARARRPSCWSRRSRSGSAAAARSIYRQRRVGRDGREFELLKLRTMVQGSDPVGVGTVVDPRRPAGHPRRPLPAPHLARRAAEPGQRPARRDGDRRPAPDDPRPGRRLHPAPAPPPRGPPGITGWAQVQGRVGIPWEERIELDVWYVEHRCARARPPDPRPHRLARPQRPGPRARTRVGLGGRLPPMSDAAQRSACARSSPATPPPCTAGSTTTRRRRR